MKSFRTVVWGLLLGAGLVNGRAQSTNALPPSAILPAKTDGLYHLNLMGSYRRPWNGDYDWWTLGTVSFGKMLDRHNSLDAMLSGGLVQLRPGTPADLGAHQPVYLGLGAVWSYYLTPPKTAFKPYVTAGANLLWMTWSYRNEVNSKNFGGIRRDFLEGLDGYAGVGLKVRLQKRLDAFAEFDVGGTAFLPDTYSGVHNDLFADFGYVGVTGGLSLKF